MRIFFEAHGTTFDNEDNKASGWNDVELSKKGIENAKDLGLRYKDVHVDAIFCSDLQRAYNTAKTAFPKIDSKKLFLDWRLRECDYGDMTREDKAKVDLEKENRIDVPFPNGESYQETMERMGSFIDDLKRMDFETVIIIGSRATHYGLDHWIKGISTEDCVRTVFAWQPGWEYEL